jgi:thiol-disulfide isomerase/thioredoxin
LGEEKKMIKPALNQNISKVLRSLKPWIGFVVILLVLRYTGLLSGLSVVTQGALIKTGMMDIQPENNLAAQPFNYNFTIRDLEGKEVNMSDFKGKVIFLNLWATWCGPCRAEMPSIQELYNKVDHEKVAFVILSLDTDENAPKISRYVNEHKFTFPIFRPNGPMPNQLRVSMIPTTFVVGTDGKIKMKKSGAANYATEDFEKFLAEQMENKESK